MVLQQIKTLEEQALDVVIRNMNRFMKDFYSPESFIPPRYFEFLQRKFSHQILAKLDQDDILKFWSYLVNPYLKILDINVLSSVPVGDLIGRIRTIGHGIDVLNLRNSIISEGELSKLVSFVPNVEELYLSNTNATNATLENIGKRCTKIRILNLNNCKITTDGLKSLCEDENGKLVVNTPLEELYINSTSDCDDIVIFAIKYFPSLKVLQHEFVGHALYEIHKSQLSNGVHEDLPAYNFTSLKVEQTYDEMHPDLITDILKVCSSVCPFVTSLTVENISQQSEVTACCEFTQIRHAKLSGPQLLPANDFELLLSSLTYIRDVDYSDLLIFRGQLLVDLELHTGRLSIEVLCNKCPNLKSLTLEDIAFDSFSSTLFKSHPMAFPKLKTLTLQSLLFDEETQESVIFLMFSSPNLEVIGFPQCRFMDDSFVANMQTCKCIKKLRIMDFSSSNLRISLAKKFVSVLPKLEIMIVSSGSISRHQYANLVSLVDAENRSIDVRYINDGDLSSDSSSDYSGESDPGYGTWQA